MRCDQKRILFRILRPHQFIFFSIKNLISVIHKNSLLHNKKSSRLKKKIPLRLKKQKTEETWFENTVRNSGLFKNKVQIESNLRWKLYFQGTG